MRRRIVLIFFLLILTGAASAQKELPVEVKADNLKFSEASGLIIASGSVEVVIEGTKIQADRLWLDANSKLVTAEGNVRFSSRQYKSLSSTLTYDASSEAADFLSFHSRLTPKTVRGGLNVSAGRLRSVKNVMKGGPGALSTCDLPEEHFSLTAASLQYSPDNYIVGQNVVLYVGAAPALWLPYLYYDLKHFKKKNWNFGHNNTEGDFVKTAWDNPWGLLLLDFIEKKGLGYGADLDYGLAALGLGSLYLYHIDEKDSGNSSWISKIEHNKQITPHTSLKFNHNYLSTYQIPAGRFDQTSFGLNLSHAKDARWGLQLNGIDDRVSQYEKLALQFDNLVGRSATYYNLNYDFAKTDPQWLRNSQRFSYRQPILGDRVDFNTATNYYHSAARAGDSGEEKIEPVIEMNGQGPGFGWNYRENWLIDLRQENYPGVNKYEHLEKHPEIDLNPRALGLPFFSLQPALGYGYYREIKYVADLGKNRDFAAHRLRTSLNASRSLPIGSSSTLNLGAGADQFNYSPGDQLFAFRENASLQTNLFSFFSNSLDFRQGYTGGNTPFFFDQLGTRYHDIRERLTFYYLDKFNWSLDGGHNWQTSKWFDVISGLTIAPDRRLRLNLNSGWDIENTRYKDLVMSLALIPASYFSLNLSAVQDMNAGEQRSGSALYDLVLMEGAPNQLHLRFSQVYDPPTRDFRVRDIMVAKDLHCWEMKYTYSDYLKQFSFTFSLKALPNEPVGFSSGRGFYYDGFERELKKLKPEEEIRRY